MKILVISGSGFICIKKSYNYCMEAFFTVENILDEDSENNFDELREAVEFYNSIVDPEDQINL